MGQALVKYSSYLTMKIALVSFEYPPDTAYGGIATYASQMVEMMAKRGHYIEVFAGSKTRSFTEKVSKTIQIHRIQVKQKIDFIRAVLPIFQARHKIIQFDVLEGPEYGADAATVVQSFPDIPFVVKLHTPRELIEIYEGQPNQIAKLRIRFGALRRGINPFRNLERTHTLEADEVATPSWALGKELIHRWGLDPAKVHQYPLPFIPNPDLLKIPIKTSTYRITFVGRLDIKKGVTDLAEAIPKVLKAFPDAQFYFIGRNGISPIAGVDMKTYLYQILSPYLSNIKFTGQVPAEQIPKYLADTDICIFPSQWESFGLVCLEAMAAGRGVIGSSAGGMAEIINSDDYGRLVPPKNPEAISNAITELLQNPTLRMQLGQNARQRVLSAYNTQHIGKLQEESYIRAINYRQKQDPRLSRLLL